jgi:hypothetical protein
MAAKNLKYSQQKKPAIIHDDTIMVDEDGNEIQPHGGDDFRSRMVARNLEKFNMGINQQHGPLNRSASLGKHL